jgi:hypothetical protein
VLHQASLSHVDLAWASLPITPCRFLEAPVIGLGREPMEVLLRVHLGAAGVPALRSRHSLLQMHSGTQEGHEYAKGAARCMQNGPECEAEDFFDLVTKVINSGGSGRNCTRNSGSGPLPLPL